MKMQGQVKDGESNQQEEVIRKDYIEHGSWTVRNYRPGVIINCIFYQSAEVRSQSNR